MKPFKKLFGNRVYLEMPELPGKNNIALTDAALKSWVEEKKLEISKWKVYAVGTEVSHIQEGDVVFVDPMALLRTTTVITLSKDLKVLAVSVFDIAHVWNDEETS